MSKRVSKTTPNKPRKISSNERAGLIISPAMIKSRMQKDRVARKISMSSAIALAAVMEYVIEETVLGVHEQLVDSPKTQFNSRNILLSIAKDAEMNALFKNSRFKHSGVVPHVHHALLPKKMGKKLSSAETDK